MSSILYYSNYCEKCKDLLRLIGKSDIKNDMHFVCIDNRFSDPNTGKIYVTLENQQKILLPPQVQKIPAMLLLNEGNTVIFGNDVFKKVKPKEEYSSAKATGFNGEPIAFTLGNDNIGGFGVASDSFSYWDQDSDELLAKGNGGTRQMYNYATVDSNTNINTPPDMWKPDKVGESAIKDMEAERNKDLQMNKRTSGSTI
jgi:glutaredoxin-related protein